MKTIVLKRGLFAWLVWLFLRMKKRPITLFYLSKKFVNAKSTVGTYEFSMKDPNLDTVLGRGGKACFKDAQENTANRTAMSKFIADRDKGLFVGNHNRTGIEAIDRKTGKKKRQAWFWIVSVLVKRPSPLMIIESAILSATFSRKVEVLSGSQIVTPTEDGFKEWIMWM